VVDKSEAAKQLKGRLLKRVQAYMDTLTFGNAVRASEVMAALMAEPGIVDVSSLRLLRYPPGFEAASGASADPDVIGCGENVVLGSTEIAVFVDLPDRLKVVL
jgi:hypothetical protein